MAALITAYFLLTNLYTLAATDRSDLQKLLYQRSLYLFMAFGIWIIAFVGLLGALFASAGPMAFGVLYIFRLVIPTQQGLYISPIFGSFTSFTLSMLFVGILAKLLYQRRKYQVGLGIIQAYFLGMYWSLLQSAQAEFLQTTNPGMFSFGWIFLILATVASVHLGKSEDPVSKVFYSSLSIVGFTLINIA